MKKEHRSALVEFVNQISDDELKYIGMRLVERMCGDLAQVLEHLETRQLTHEVLSSANSSEEVFATLNILQEIIQKEANRRKIVLSIRPLIPVD
jgi:hypothetical protein